MAVTSATNMPQHGHNMVTTLLHCRSIGMPVSRPYRAIWEERQSALCNGWPRMSMGFKPSQDDTRSHSPRNRTRDSSRAAH